MQKRRLKLSFNKSGSGSMSASMRLPITWIKRMNIDPENRELDVKFIGTKITIKKAEDNNMDLNLSQVASEMHEILINNNKGINAVVIFEEESSIKMMEINHDELYLKNNPKSEFICVLTIDDCKRGVDYVIDYIEDKFYEKTNSVEYTVKHQIHELLSTYCENLEYKLDIINNYLHIDNYKLCRIDYIKFIIFDVDALILDLINDSKVYVCIHGFEEPFIDQIYINSKRCPIENPESYFVEYDVDGNEIYSKMIHSVLIDFN